MNEVNDYIKKISDTYASGHAREHSYRPALKELFEKISALSVINEPKRSEYGAPDFVFIKGKTVVAYAEAKDINVLLDEIEKSEQMTRYYGYSNIILTNGLDFRFYRNAAPYGESVVVGKLKNENIEVFENQFQLLADTISAFIKESKEPIKTGAVLSKVMAGKARRIRDNVKKFLEDEKNPKNDNLFNMFRVVKRLLLADLDHEKFADMYAQTIVYGLFVARFNDKTPDNFTRQEARDLIPPSNPFLREFFNHIAGSSFDSRIEYIVNELCEEFNHADVREIIHKYYKTDLFGKVHESKDPIIHFYEDFLQEYDPVERKKMGVFYTPLPVVRFIVRAVDDILKKEFALTPGLADNSKIEITKEIQGKRHKIPVHRVQVLDPATGTGTFLNEAIHHIKKSFEGQEGRWSSYVNEDLLPRLHGFELMMASYTIAHLKLSSTLAESGAKIEDTRLGVYLTNSLEKAEIEQQDLFNIGLGKAITEESNQANKVKNDLPIMVVMGNPPYSGVSSNETEYANGLVDKYKVEPKGKQKLQERKHWLNDDYVKFIALAEDMVYKNGEGVVGFITNHGYLDNPTFRGMRWHLMDTFDSIYVIDLHGNSKKKEVSPDGNKDENVFAIQQGVAIMIAVKTGNKKKGELAKVYRGDVWGKKKDKFEQLNNLSINNASWTSLESRYPNLVFGFEGSKVLDEDYRKGFSLDNIFNQKATGIVTAIDSLAIFYTNEDLEVKTKSILTSENPYLEFKIKDGRKYKKEQRLEELRAASLNNATQIFYRPFDIRYMYYTEKSECWINSPRFETMKHIINKENLGLVFTRQAIGGDKYDHVMVTKLISDNRVLFSNKGIPIEAPLYLYAEDGSKVPNLKKEIINEIEITVGKTTPENILDYIYVVLHSPNYRERYKEFLKTDFPRIPYPKDKSSFDALIALGKELRELHLLESPKLRKLITTFSEAGSDIVDAKYPKYKDGNVYINEKQYFGGVPEIAWNFYIGGYQPAQKWLKDRQGRVLSSEDLEHYQKMIVVFVETVMIMEEIGKKI